MILHPREEGVIACISVEASLEQRESVCWSWILVKLDSNVELGILHTIYNFFRDPYSHGNRA